MASRRTGSSLAKKFARFINLSPSPRAAKNHLLRLIEVGTSDTLDKIPPTQLPTLFRLLGGSAFLSDVLIREGAHWPELFLRQIAIAQKSTADHLQELDGLNSAPRSRSSAPPYTVSICEKIGWLI